MVTRYGCSRGDFFEGCETRCGEIPQVGVVGRSRSRAAGRRSRAAGHLRMAFGSGGRGDGNTANPFRHRDATSPGAQCGANRRGGEKPRGRNVTVRLVPYGRRRRRRLWELLHWDVVGGGGTQRSKPTRGRSVEGTSETTSGDAASGASGRSVDEAKFTRDARVIVFQRPITGHRVRM